MAFEKLREIIELDVEYTTKSALAISAGKQPAEVVESPVIKLAGMPVIPGSSLKGALRSTLEAMLAQQGVKVCVPFAAIPKGIRGDEQRRKEYLAKLGRLEPCQDIENPCPICAIFGTIGGQAGSRVGPSFSMPLLRRGNTTSSSAPMWPSCGTPNLRQRAR